MVSGHPTITGGEVGVIAVGEIVGTPERGMVGVLERVGEREGVRVATKTIVTAPKAKLPEVPKDVKSVKPLFAVSACTAATKDSSVTEPVRIFILSV